MSNMNKCEMDVEFRSKFQGRVIKISRVNSICVAKPLFFFNIFFDRIGLLLAVSDVIMSFRFLCVELASTSP